MVCLRTGDYDAEAPGSLSSSVATRCCFDSLFPVPNQYKFMQTSILGALHSCVPCSACGFDEFAVNLILKSDFKYTLEDTERCPISGCFVKTIILF